jgi:hypothetical protein
LGNTFADIGRSGGNTITIVDSLYTKKNTVFFGRGMLDLQSVQSPGDGTFVVMTGNTLLVYKVKAQ